MLSPSNASSATGNSSDVVRQLVVIIATVATIILNYLSSGITGHSVGDIAHQYPALITPADYAFAIWGVIYAFLIAYTVYQALPSQRANPRLRRIGYLYVLACAGNIGWELLWLSEHISLSLLAMLVLLGSLLAIYLLADMNRAQVSRGERWCVNTAFGIYLGWITVATIANVAAILYSVHWNGWGVSPQAWTVIVLLVGIAIAVFVAVSRVDIAYMLVIVWAFVAVLVKNLQSTAITIAATATVLIALATIVYIAVRRRELLHYSL